MKSVFVEKMAKQNSRSSGEFMKINILLLPIKLHYFLLLAALGAVMSFMQILGKGLGINAGAVGIIFTILHFSGMLAKPAFGAVIDHFGNIKSVIVILLIFTMISNYLILFIPEINPHIPNKQVFLECTNDLSELTFSKNYNASCLSEKLVNDAYCNVKIHKCLLLSNDVNETGDHVTTCNTMCNATIKNFTLKFVPKSPHLNTSRDTIRFKIASIQINDELFSKSCSCATASLDTLTCVPSIQICSYSHSNEDDNFIHDVYYTYQFWTFAILVITAGIAEGVLFCLSDAICYEILGDRPYQYGRQRLWATVSWGMSALLTGFLNDLASKGLTRINYAPGFYVMIGFAFLDLILIFKMKFTKTTISANLCKDVSSVFVSCEVIAFAIATFIVGVFSSIVSNFHFWFLQSLGASQLLLGLTIVVQCLLAEIPFFFFSGYIIKKLGHMNCLILTFAAFSLRFILYYILENPWYVFPIEFLHGQTFGTFHASMTSFAQAIAPPGSEATMQGVLGGLCKGSGFAVGGLIGGFAFDELGGHRTFLASALVSAVCTLSFCVIGQVFKKMKKGDAKAMSETTQE